jgi:hypothetical protein
MAEISNATGKSVAFLVEAELGAVGDSLLVYSPNTTRLWQVDFRLVLCRIRHISR